MHGAVPIDPADKWLNALFALPDKSDANKPMIVQLEVSS